MQYVLIFVALMANLWGVVPAEPQPRVDFKFFVDNQPYNERMGAPVSAKTLRMQGTLDQNSAKLYPELTNQPIIAKSVVSLARGSRRIAAMQWNSNDSFNLIMEARSGDRLVIAVNEVEINQKNGAVKKIAYPNGLIYTVPLY